MDKKIADLGRFFEEKSDFGGAGKDIGMEKSEKKKNRRKIADFSDKNRFFSDKNRFFPGKNRFLPIKTDFFWNFFFFDFFPDSKNMQKIASDGFRTHPKCLEMAPSNHQAIDCTYYI